MLADNMSLADSLTGRLACIRRKAGVQDFQITNPPEAGVVMQQTRSNMRDGGFTEKIVRHAGYRMVSHVLVVSFRRFSRAIKEIDFVRCQIELQWCDQSLNNH